MAQNELGEPSMDRSGSSVSRLPRRRDSRARPDWRSVNHEAATVEVKLIAVTSGLGIAGLISARFAREFLGSLGSSFSILFLWAAFGFAFAAFLTRRRPEGVFRFRPLDALWGLSAGLFLRLLQGLASGANQEPFPTTLNGLSSFGVDAWATLALPAAVIAPALEEIFFRVIIFTTVFRILVRRIGFTASAVTASLISAGFFVLFHAYDQSLDLQGSLQFLAVGLACSMLLVLTGRVWAALFAHLIYNLTYLAILWAGAVLAS